ncbi:formin-like protein 14 [Miscanthus floridulus]|uniref:formin-like protein 14 n=1 Tax=Miscanthus floridulus TaxID=154761 RepID=UPI0034575B93
MRRPPPSPPSTELLASLPATPSSSSDPSRRQVPSPTRPPSLPVRSGERCASTSAPHAALSSLAAGERSQIQRGSQGQRLRRCSHGELASPSRPRPTAVPPGTHHCSTPAPPTGPPLWAPKTLRLGER